MYKKTTICFTLFFVACFAFESYAQSELGLVAIGGEIGFVNPEGPIGETISLGAMAGLGKLTKDLNLNVRLSYWSKSEGPASLRDFHFGGAIVYSFQDEIEQLLPYAGGGLSLHFLKGKVGSVIDEFSDTKLGIDLLGGVRYKFNDQIDFTGEVMMILGDAEQLHVKFGAIFKLGL